MTSPDGAMTVAQSTPASEGPCVDSWSEKDQKIVVSQPAAGFLYDLILRAKIDAAPDEVYKVLKDPHSHEIFRGIKQTLRRTTVEDNGKGRRKLRVGHRAVTKFLWLSVTFDTELYVWEDDNERSIRFTNARSDGFMKKFDGTWHVQPFTQHTLDSIYRPEAVQQQPQQQTHSKWLSPAGVLSAVQQRLPHGSSSQQPDVSTLVTLEQALAPRVRPPGPVAHIVRGLCARVLHNMMEDLRTEVHRREALRNGVCTCALKDCQCGSKQLKQQQPGSASLPVASITSSTGILNTATSRSSNKHNRTWWKEEIGSSSSCWSGGDLHWRLQDLFALAAPLDIVIKL